MSALHSTDRYGHKYQINFEIEDFVVFSCSPELSFDVGAHGLKVRQDTDWDYSLSYNIKDGSLYMTMLEGNFGSAPEIMGVRPDHSRSRRLLTYRFDIPVDYTGVWQIGADFDFRFWSEDEKAKPTPFSPEVYKQNGFIRFEKGKVVEMELNSR